MNEYKLTDKEHQSITKLSAPRRYEHTIKRITDWENVWSLKSDDGWALLGDNEGHDCVPIWPHSRYAQDFAVNQ